MSDRDLRSESPEVRARAEWRAGLRLYPDPFPLGRPLEEPPAIRLIALAVWTRGVVDAIRAERSKMLVTGMWV